MIMNKEKQLELISKALLGQITDFKEEELRKLMSYESEYISDYPLLFKKVNDWITSIEKHKEIARKHLREWEKASILRTQITDRWIEQGCTWTNTEALTKWYYKDEVFYSWWSGAEVLKELPLVIEADERLQNLIEKYEDYVE